MEQTADCRFGIRLNAKPRSAYQIPRDATEASNYEYDGRHTSSFIHNRKLNSIQYTRLRKYPVFTMPSEQ